MFVPTFFFLILTCADHVLARTGPGFHKLVEDIASEFVKMDEEPVPIVMDNWDSLYPFSRVCDRRSENDIMPTTTVLNAVQILTSR